MARGYMSGSGGAGGADVSVVTATASDVLIDKIFVDSTESPVTGTMPNNGALGGTLALNGTFTIPAGYTTGGIITQNISTKGAETYNTSASDQSIAAGQYLSGAQTIKAVTTANISAANIKKGVTVSVGDENDAGRIVNVEGTYTTVSSGQTPVVAGAMLSGYSGFADGGAEVKGNIATKTSSDMTVSGATVTAPAGYYASNASKAIPAGTATGAGSGQQSAPSISINSAGKITASVAAKTISCTPSVSAGYISSGTAGNVSLTANSATKQMTTKAATTYKSTTSNQSIAAGTYLTGAITIQGDANLVAANIKSGKSILGVAGSCKEYKKSETNVTTQSSKGTWTNISSWGGYSFSLSYFNSSWSIGFQPVIVYMHSTSDYGIRQNTAFLDNDNIWISIAGASVSPQSCKSSASVVNASKIYLPVCTNNVNTEFRLHLLGYA